MLSAVQEVERTGTELGSLALSVFSHMRQLDFGNDADAVALRGLVDYATNKVARPVLASGSRREFNKLLDDLALGREVGSLNVLFARCIDFSTAPKIKLGTTLSEVAAKSLEPSALASLVEGQALLNAWLRGAQNVLASLQTDEISGVASNAAQLPPSSWLLTSLEVPPELAIAVLGGLHANVCLLGLSLAIDESQRLSDWLGEALVGRLLRGARDHIRLVASHDEAHVPLSVVPKKERIDLKLVHTRNQKAMALFKGDQRRLAGL
jgi:hypothetical protein